MAEELKKWAVFSPCRRWRYELWRQWDGKLPFCMFIGLNPSTADENLDDPTVRRCIRYARDWGYGALCMTNIFAWRDTDPKKMKAQTFPIGKENDNTLSYRAGQAGIVIAAWGTHGAHLGRHRAVMDLLPQLHALKVTKDGFPNHPLYLPLDAKPILFSLSL